MIDFEKEVLERSYAIPVVVDFWAPWCGPCRVLGPVMEELAAEQEGRWELVKLNTEEHEDLAYRYMIRSIPNVKMFYRGEVINEFLGALPKTQIQAWLQKALPHPGVMALDRLLQIQDQPDPAEVEKLLDQYPDAIQIRIVLGQLILWDQPSKVLELLEPVKMGTPYYDKATWLRDIASFLLMETNDPSLVKVQDFLKHASLEEAIQDMIVILGKNNAIADKLLAKAAIGIFNTLGHHHPLAKSYRKKLDMVLWV